PIHRAAFEAQVVLGESSAGELPRLVGEHLGPPTSGSPIPSPLALPPLGFLPSVVHLGEQESLFRRARGFLVVRDDGVLAARFGGPLLLHLHRRDRAVLGLELPARHWGIPQ